MSGVGEHREHRKKERECLHMGEKLQPGSEKNTTVEQLSSLNRRQLKELEEKEKTRAQKILEAVVMIIHIVPIKHI